ncbi:ABC transporter substrate-binding protein [Mesorhizobium sp. BR1-1-16]|uniref:ABC transporter substrate-binding protein n=1 Tax=Mesorhizobium sp. BR1-1-16 TaxID=2876653 RepID=UPI001CCF9853|nr:ABC transporter substrate-binding protein [Mesorhizobium sp. BR1-1-16]MBZ9937257.1 ABC transporter substrate-binding protein [Mesorhizobium sp. BR1-1-16]
MKTLRIALLLATGLVAGPAMAADASKEITVWVDATRQPAVEVFQKAHPEIKVNMVVDDGSSGASGTFQTKIGLADQAGEGWPDVVFSTQNNDAAWAAKETNGVQAFAAALNKDILDQSFLDGFTPGALDPVTIDGNVYGLRNDLAPVLFWYNKPLLDQFGYDIPKTWEDYQALGDKLAKDHPGYFLGSIGDAFEGPYIYYWSGQAPIFQVKGDEFVSNVDDPNAAKVTALLDHMLKNGTVTQESVFSAPFAAKADHLVAIPGPAWYSGAIFQNPSSVNAKPGTWGAAPPLYWEKGDKVTGNVGGGVWYASSHTQNPDAVKTFLEFVITNDETAGTGGLPAYQAAAAKWLDKQASAGFYVGDFKNAVSTAASTVWDGWAYPNFSPETAWAKVITPALAAGKSISDVAADWQKEMQNEAQVVGYTVN